MNAKDKLKMDILHCLAVVAKTGKYEGKADFLIGKMENTQPLPSEAREIAKLELDQIVKETENSLADFFLIENPTEGQCAEISTKVSEAICQAYSDSQNPLWTDGDIDAAYCLGGLNVSPEKLPEGTVFPSLHAVVAECERLKENGFNAPHEAIRELRYGKNPQKL